MNKKIQAYNKKVKADKKKLAKLSSYKIKSI
jgi:hypothetical protein